jgi:kinetochore protein Spc7/SPC105
LNVDPSSQPPSTTNSQSSVFEDVNATRSMEVTQDYTTPGHDNISRKSLGRRVSFASHSHVRMFEKDHTNSTGSPQSSPAPAFPDGPADVTNENDYPRKSSYQRRSSTRYSLAQSEDMDLTSVIPGTFQPGGSAILDEDLGDYDDEDDYNNDDMDVTEVIRGDFARKRSLSLGIRQPLAQIPSIPAPISDDADRSQSDIGNESIQSDATSEQSQAMEFTVPLGQSLRPADQNQAWLALKQATHSGNNTSDPELSSDNEMELDDAMSRLKRARDSMLAQPNIRQNEEPQDSSFTSTDDSFEDDGNKTVNFSQAFGRASMGQVDSRLSMGYQNSDMDESEVYGAIALAKRTPRQSMAPSTSVVQPPAPQQPPKSPVFRPPPSNEASKQPVTSNSYDKATVPVPFSFTPKVPSSFKSNPLLTESPSKNKPKPTFSAAFAPPVSRPSPKKATTSMEPHSSPNKRPRSIIDDVENQDVDQPSPPKRQALSGKSLAGPTSTLQQSNHKPKPLSPSKKAPFQLPPPAAPDPTSRPSSVLRRPSGYYAKRKSLVVGSIAPPSNATSTAAPVSPKKKPGIGLGRASLGSGPSNAWARFNKDAEQVVGSTSKVEKEPEPDREAAREASTSPIPTGGSPNSNSPKTQVELEELVTEPTQMAEPLDVGEPSITMGIDMDATQQWREGVQQDGQYEEDAVCSKPVFND